MKNYASAANLLTWLNENKNSLSEKHLAEIENLAIRMVKPPKVRNRRLTNVNGVHVDDQVTYYRDLHRVVARQLRQWINEDSGRTYKIAAIKFVRNRMSWSLLEAKKWIEKNFSNVELNRSEDLTF